MRGGLHSTCQLVVQTLLLGQTLPSPIYQKFRQVCYQTQLRQVKDSLHQSHLSTTPIRLLFNQYTLLVLTLPQEWQHIVWQTCPYQAPKELQRSSKASTQTLSPSFTSTKGYAQNIVSHTIKTRLTALYITAQGLSGKRWKD